MSIPSSRNRATVHRTVASRSVRVPFLTQYKKSYPDWDNPFYGAADGTRTRTVSLPGDFKSPVSTDSTTAASGPILTRFFQSVKAVKSKSQSISALAFYSKVDAWRKEYRRANGCLRRSLPEPLQCRSRHFRLQVTP